jgi:hypothetical protein
VQSFSDWADRGEVVERPAVVKASLFSYLPDPPESFDWGVLRKLEPDAKRVR